MDGPGFLRCYDPALPISSSNPSITNIPTFGSGLALMPNINGGTLTPTFYTTFLGTYWYWDGLNWINTGHSTGNTSAQNIAGCSNTIYNLVGNTGQIYTYNGTGPGTLLTTISNFNGNGPFDLVSDCNCNFYILNTLSPNQGLTLYNASGNVLCTYSLNGMPSTSGGGGFAIVANKIYVKNNVGTGFFVGTIGTSVVNFTQSTVGLGINPGDFASCPACYSAGSFTDATITQGAVLNCLTSSLPLAVTSTVSPLTYSWSGPGITGSTGGSFVTVSQPGTYSCVVTTNFCPIYQTTLTTVVSSNSVNVQTSVTPGGSVCVGASQWPFALSASYTPATAGVSWTGPSVVSGNSAGIMLAGGAGVYTLTVTDAGSGCSKTDIVSLVQKPSTAGFLSSPSVCARPFNGSPNSILLNLSGASSYSLFSSSNYSIAGSGINYTCVPVAPFVGSNSQASLRIIGKNYFCLDTLYTSFVIVANPGVTVTPASSSICPYDSQQLSVSGASSYNWLSSPGVQAFSGSSMTALPGGASVYSVFGSDQGCNSATEHATVVTLPLPVLAASPTASLVCIGSTLGLYAPGTATGFTWSPSIGLSSTNASFVVTLPQQSQSYTVLGSLNGCTSQAVGQVNVQSPPVISLALSSASICSDPYNNSPNTLLATPSGATNYTLLGAANAVVSSANGPVMTVVANTSPFTGTAVGSVVLHGNTGVCNVSLTKTFVIVANPVVNVSPANATICPGGSRVFNLSGASSYTWTPDPTLNVFSSTGAAANPTVTHFYAVSGSSAGCNSNVKNAILVVTPVPTVVASPALCTVCAGNTVALYAQTNGVALNWFPNNTVLSASGGSAVVTPSATMAYTALVSIGTCTNLALATVSVVDVPAISVSASDPTVCSGAATRLTATGALQFQWFPTQSLNQPLGNLVLASPDVSTTYTVKGFNGLCTATGTIYIEALRRPSLELLAEVNTVCKGSALTITATGAQSYTWLPALTVEEGAYGPVAKIRPEATTNYTVIAGTSSGTVSCLEQKSYSVIVVNAPAPATSGNVSICRGQKTTLSARGGNTYVWSPAQGLNATSGPAVVASPSVSSVYWVEVSYGTYCGATATLMVEVNPKPTVFAGRDTTYSSNEAIFVSAGGQGVMKWISGEGIACSDCQRTRVFPTISGCYVVETTNEYGCTASDQVCITLNKEFTSYVPNSFTPNNDGKNDVFFVYGENIQNMRLEIFDRWGKRVFLTESEEQGWDGTFNDQQCIEGVYVYSLEFKGLDGKFYTRTGNVNLIR